MKPRRYFLLSLTLTFRKRAKEIVIESSEGFFKFKHPEKRIEERKSEERSIRPCLKNVFLRAFLKQRNHLERIILDRAMGSWRNAAFQ